MHTLRWTSPRGEQKGRRTPPTIKNHTATRIGGELFVFGGYDGVRNHNAVHILNCETLEWSEAEVCVSDRSFSTYLPLAGDHCHRHLSFFPTESILCARQPTSIQSDFLCFASSLALSPLDRRKPCRRSWKRLRIIPHSNFRIQLTFVFIRVCIHTHCTDLRSSPSPAQFVPNPHMH